MTATIEIGRRSLTIEDMSSAEAAPRAAWQMAVIAFAVLFGLSEAIYLALGLVAKTCLAEGAACGQLATAVSQALFAQTVSESGAPMMANVLSIGLPGFNNLFYIFVAGIGVDDYGRLGATVAASVIIGFVMLWGYFAASANRGIVVRLLLAVVFAVGWWVLYNNTEASIYKVEFFMLVLPRYLELPIAAAWLFFFSFFVRRRG